MEKVARLRVGKIKYKSGAVLHLLPSAQGNLCTDMVRKHMPSIASDNVCAVGLFYVTDVGVFYEAARLPDTPYSYLVGAARCLENSIVQGWADL